MGARTAGREERLHAVKQAALELSTEQGYDATTVRQIAARAKVSTGTVMSFGDKDTLLLQIFEDAITDRMPHPRPNGSTPAQAVWLCFKPYFDFYDSHPEISRPYAKILFSRSVDEHPALGAQAAQFTTLVGAQITERLPHVSKADARLAAEALFAAYMHSLITWIVDATTVSQAKAALRKQIAWQLSRFDV